MSTFSERLEAEVWLESTFPDLPPELRETFFIGVDEYYAQHPIADRRPDVLTTLEDDSRAFALLLRDVLSQADTLATAFDSLLDVRST
ncbi:hypothetical protein [Brachybacterium sp.]|uniref:hypothetical protein n=1 Tax=Brachybacterium sp. TaxID=1891286 RepID=UPI002ED36921